MPWLTGGDTGRVRGQRFNYTTPIGEVIDFEVAFPRPRSYAVFIRHRAERETEERDEKTVVEWKSGGME
jgi:hypothetical protein